MKKKIGLKGMKRKKGRGADMVKAGRKGRGKKRGGGG